MPAIPSSVKDTLYEYYWWEVLNLEPVKEQGIFNFYRARQERIYTEHFTLLLERSLTLPFHLLLLLNCSNEAIAYIEVAICFPSPRFVFTTWCNCDKKCIYQCFWDVNMALKIKLWRSLSRFGRALSHGPLLFWALISFLITGSPWYKQDKHPVLLYTSDFFWQWSSCSSKSNWL